MALMEWNKKLETGNPHVDEQHQAMLHSFNHLYDALKNGYAAQETCSTLAFLRNYTVTHFLCEEQLMCQHNYPGYEAHKLLHENFVTKVDDFYYNFENKLDTSPLSTLELMLDWILDHIQTEDFKIVQFLEKKQ